MNLLSTAKTGVEYVEPLRQIARSPKLVVPFGLRPGTTLDEPPVPIPAGHVVGTSRGQLFYRDTGGGRGRGTAGTVLLLHGWMVPSDPHWFRTFGTLERQGWRVLALDARGHGRGPRGTNRFRLADCARDAVALVEHLKCGPVTVVGYSMGGMVAQIMAREAPSAVEGLVLCATACEFRTNLIMRGVWSSMAALQLGWQLAPIRFWAAVGALAAKRDPEIAEWMAGELSRGAAWDVAEAGREIGRFDSRPWLDEIESRTVVMVTLADLLVPPGRQRELARRLGAPVVEVNSDHLAPGTTPRRFHAALGRSLALLESTRTAAAA
ncbi:MAG: hypothetical protein NVSMB25_04860 [Thermoleophilaceae bacterium]